MSIMKKNGVLNSPISKVLSGLRHTDQIVIGDAGLPVPNGVKEIDLSLKLGVPTFIDVLEVIIEDMKIEKIILAQEIQAHNPTQLKNVSKLIELEDEAIEYVSHEKFKELTQNTKAIIRTGEMTPYSNVILQADVIF